MTWRKRPGRAHLKHRKPNLKEPNQREWIKSPQASCLWFGSFWGLVHSGGVMQSAETATTREKHFREMAVWHDWPIPEVGEPPRAAFRTNIAPPERIATFLGGIALAA